MTPIWSDAGARARGLASRLLPPEALDALAAAPDLQSLARELAAHEVVPDESAGASAPTLDRALRRGAAGTIAILRRWLGDRQDALAVALDAEDRRSLRALLRGAAAGVSAESRLTGLVPTPALPERLLRDLAARNAPREQAVLLVAAGHPFGRALVAASAGPDPDLFGLEVALEQAYWERARVGAHRAGGFLARHVAALVDRENCRAALLLAGAHEDGVADRVFIEGGARIRRATFREAAESGDPVAAARILATALDSAAAEPLLRHAHDPAALDATLLDDEIAAVRRESRRDPLGPAPVLHYLLLLRRQMQALGRLVWSIEHAVPVGLRRTTLCAEAAG